MHQASDSDSDLRCRSQISHETHALNDEYTTWYNQMALAKKIQMICKLDPKYGQFWRNDWICQDFEWIIESIWTIWSNLLGNPF